MLKKSILCSFFLATLFAESEDACGDVPFPRRITMRHIEANGVGYNQGYTTLEGFFAPEAFWGDRWLPFLDVRAHLFNSGKPAANAGVGVRYFSSRIWGINAYYDYRKTSKQQYNQISMGLESLGRIWDFRVNGYLPVGTTKSSYFDTQFDKFKTHYMIIRQKREFAMRGANAEVGVHVDSFKHTPLYFAAGPYYLRGEGKTAWGGELRGALDIFDYARVEGSTSYDSVFKWIGQGQISIILPLGKQKRAATCALARGLQRVDRNEIIPVDRKRKISKAIDPATGQPYFFWFVDNLSHSQGTFESPFNTLLAAQKASVANDVIYVFPGDGTTRNLDTGMILKDGQKFFGAGTRQTLATTAGVVTIPPLANGMPMIVNQLIFQTIAIRCANNNEISGFQLSVGGFRSAIDCSSIQNVAIHNNSFNLGFVGVGINLFNTTGTATITDNAFTFLGTSALGVQFSGQPKPATYIIKGNQFVERSGIGIVTVRAIGLDGGATFGGTFEITQNQFTGCDSVMGANLFNYNSTMIFNQNVMTNCGHIGTSSVFFGIDGTFGGSLAAEVNGNVWQNSGSVTGGLSVDAMSNGNVCLILQNNLSDRSLFLNNMSMGTFTVDAANNVPDYTPSGSVTAGVCP